MLTHTDLHTPFRILGRYKWPKKGRYCSIMGRDLTAITKELGLIPFDNDDIQRNANPAWSDYDLHAEVRMTAVSGSEGEDWHQDGDTSTDNMDCALVLWTNRDPTLFRFKDSDIIYQPDPFEIVIARNLGALHKRPPQAAGKRFLFRQRVEVPEWLI